MTKLDDLDIHKLMQRLEKFEKTDIEERLGYIEQQLKYFIHASMEISSKFKDGIRVSFDENSINISRQLSDMMRKSLATVQDEVLRMTTLRKDMQEERLKLTQRLKDFEKDDGITGAIKYMAKQLTELTQHVHQIKEEGIKKQICLDVSMDGYQMVKKIPINLDPLDEKPFDPDASIVSLIKSLEIREGKVLVHRFGLLGEKSKTLVATGKALNISGERVRAIQMKALRKCRHLKRAHLIEEITHNELRLAIMGEEL